MQYSHDIQNNKRVLKKAFQYCSLEGSLEARQLVQHTAQSPDVTLLVIRLSLTQLWGDIARSPNHLHSESRGYDFSTLHQDIKTFHVPKVRQISSQCTLCSCWRGFWRCQSHRFSRSSGACQEGYSESWGHGAELVCCARDIEQAKSARKSEGWFPHPGGSYSASVCSQPGFHLQKRKIKAVN